MLQPTPRQHHAGPFAIDHPCREVRDHANLDRPGPKVHPKVTTSPSRARPLRNAERPR